MRARLKKFLPFLKWTPLLSKKSLSKDVLAGVTGALVVLPQAIAFAAIAGMPPEYGLYAAMVPTIIAALFGSSRHLVTGPTTTSSLILFSSLCVLAEPGSEQYIKLALTLAFMVGIMKVALGVFKMGALINFISHSVVIGFTAGAGILIVANQLKDFFGLSIPRGSKFTEILIYIATHLSDISWSVTSVAVVTCVTALLSRFFFPRIPYMLVAIFIGSSVSAALHAWFGIDLPTAGAIPSHLPPFSAPQFSFSVWHTLAPTAAALTLVTLTEALSISRAIAARSGQHINANQEFIGQGLSNFIGSFFSGYVATGSFNRSALNYTDGAKTPLAAVFSALVLMLIVMLVAPWVEYLPNAAMAGLLLIVGWSLIDVHHITQIYKASRAETFVLIATFSSTLLFDIQKAIFTGVLLSLGVYLHKTSHPSIHVRVPDATVPQRKLVNAREGLPECPQLRIIRVDGDMFFGAVSSFQETLNRFDTSYSECKHLLIEMQGVNFIDVAGAEALSRTAERFKKKNGTLYLLKPKSSVMKFLDRGGYMKDIHSENVFYSTGLALNQIFKTLDKKICAGCTRRIFVECKELPN